MITEPGGTNNEFSFVPTPPALTLPAAASAMGTTSCALVFDLMVDPMAPAGTVDMEAVTMGVCDPTGVMLNSSATGTANLTISALVPTAPPHALVALAILLLVGGAYLLRRRQVVA